MALNKHMHPRNGYKDNPPDFIELSKQYPEFKPYVKYNPNGKAFVNFRIPSVVRILTKCLLNKDFELDVDLPSDRLSPTVPSRLNYILWIEDLLNATSQEFTKQRHIVDIGTGSACIYPLLGMRNNPDWKFTATEIDSLNFKNAVNNIEKNSLKSSIKVLKVDKSATTSLLLHLFQDANDGLDLCMCNPPFFNDSSEIETKIGPIANSSCHANDVESITDGGDLAFAHKLFEESLELKQKVTWYTILMGKKSSFVTFKKQISKYSEILVTTYEFCQGRTIRWGIGWSFCSDMITESKLPRSSLQNATKNSEVVKPITFSLRKTLELNYVYDSLKRELSILGISFMEIENNKSLVILKLQCEKCNWVHIRRRSRKRKLDGVCNGGSVKNLIEESPLTKNHSDCTLPNGVASTLLQCEVTILKDSFDHIKLQFKTEIRIQKEVMNTLVVYLKRILLSDIT
uniref:RNA N6-adenosine-methyltransferase METTL16-like n=1 Tax=Styela clava TaxID=7725 RepID=UPI0019395933|nr:RNA N6-adenosine-methyltransferase METTL16-like [Styela clava]